jgi:LacI family transcriptional regulator
MKDIAEKLKLSPTTVSHVLTGKAKRYRIGDETIKRVQRMAERMGFQSNHLARAFKAQKSHSVALVVGDLTNPFWTGVAIGAQREAEAHGYTLFVCNTEEALERERRTVMMLQERRVDGLILSPTHLKEDYLESLHKQGLPFVLVDRLLEDLPVPFVLTDNVAGAAMAAEHLIRRGHKRIAYIGGPERIMTFRDRFAGFTKKLDEHGLEPAAVLTIDASVDDAAEAVKTLLAKAPRPTALFTGNIWITMGALQAIQNAGLSVPQDIDIVGFDDLPRANLLRYPVTTVAQEVDAMGREAFRLLLKVINGEKVERGTLLKPRLVVR